MATIEDVRESQEGLPRWTKHRSWHVSRMLYLERHPTVCTYEHIFEESYSLLCHRSR